MRSIEIQIVPRTSDIGNLEESGRCHRERRSVGSFVFWDQFGPGELLENEGIDVRPHLTSDCQQSVTCSMDRCNTVTVLVTMLSSVRCREFNDRRLWDCSFRAIRRGIETGCRKALRYSKWLALPISLEETAPDFMHYGQPFLPTFTDQGVEGRVLLGTWQTLCSPVSFPLTRYTWICR